MHQLILASQSPRRLELLRLAGYECTVDMIKVSEIIDKNLNLTEAIKALSQVKVQALLQQRKFMKGQKILILGADTVVVLGENVLGKPKDLNQAQDFLRRLSGQEHRVITALSLYDVEQEIWDIDFDETFIRFRNLSSEEIDNYLRQGESWDKAGAYALQGEARHFVEERRGSWSNVVGLPLELFERMLLKNGWQLTRHARTTDIKNFG